MRKLTPLVLLTPFALAACGGSTTGLDNVSSYESIRTTVSVPFANEIDASTAVSLTSTPVESSAQMSGIFRVYEGGNTNNESIAGQIDMNANFAGGTVNGTLSNLIQVDSVPFGGGTPVGRDISGGATYSGTINVGSASRGDITATGSGNYTNTSGTTYNVTFDLDGDLYRRPTSDLGAAGIIDTTATGGGSTIAGRGGYIVTE